MVFIYMSEHFLDTKKLLHMIVRVPKKHAAFFYFTFEAHENFCFFSTLKESLQTPYRDIEITGTIEFKDDIHHTIESLQEKFPIEILSEEIIIDGPFAL